MTRAKIQLQKPLAICWETVGKNTRWCFYLKVSAQAYEWQPCHCGGANCAMVNHPMTPLPPKAAELVREYNVWTSREDPGGLYNFVTGIWTQQQDGTYVAEIMKPHVPNHEYFVNKDDPWTDMSSTGYEVTIHHDGNPMILQQIHKIQNCALVYIHQAFYANDDHITIDLTSTSILADWSTTGATRDWIVELCAGGYGGWHFAARFLAEHGYPTVKFASVEIQLQAAVSNALNHHAMLIRNDSEVPPDFLQKADHSVVFQAAVQDHEWLKHVAQIRPFAAVISAPCPPWSVSGMLRGLNDDNGMVFLHCIGRLRILQPEWVAIEQVCGFKNHDHYQTLMAAFNWAGFEKVDDVMIDLAEMCPVRRPRWLGLFCRKDLKDLETVSWKRWIRRLEVTPQTFGSFVELLPQECQLFEPTVKEAQMYLDSSLMPGPIRSWTKAQMLQYRIPGLTQKQGTFMYAYGNQHNLPAYRLLNRGLFGFFVRQANTFRFWTPWEQALLHLQTHGLIMLKPKHISWQFLGNQISTPHGVLVLMNLFLKANPKDAFMLPNELFQKLFNERLTIANTACIQDEFAWYIDRPHEVGRTQQKLLNFVHQLGWTSRPEENFTPDFPASKWWHPVHGLQQGHLTQEIDPTIPYGNEDPITSDLILADNKEAGIYHAQTLFLRFCIKEVWNDRLVIATSEEVSSRATQPCEETPTVVLASRTTQPILEHQAKDQNTSKDEEDPFGVVLLRQNPKIIFFEVPTKLSWSQIKKRIPGLDQEMYDHYGKLQGPDPIEHLTVLQDEPPPELQPLGIEFPFEHLQPISCETRIIPKHETLQIQATGPTEALGHMAHLWNQAFPTEWRKDHGCVIHLQEIGENKIQFLFRSPPGHLCEGQTMTPCESLNRIVPIRLLQTGLMNLQSTSDHAIPIIVKYRGRVVMVWKADKRQTFAPVLQLLRHAFMIQEFGHTPAIISKGRRCGDQCTPEDLRARSLPGFNQARALVCTITDPLLGGGPELGAKNAMRQMLQSKTASLLLEYGIDLQQVPAYTAKILQEVGYPRMQHLHHAAGATAKYQDFLEICRMCDIKLPKGPSSVPLTDAKFAKLARTRQHVPPEQFEVSEYLLQEGYFKNEDGSNAIVLSTFQPRSSGIYLANAKQAEQWLSTQQPISEDELGLFVVGVQHPETKLPTDEVTAPATNSQGRAVLLQGALVQLGTRLIKVPESDSRMNITCPVHVCGVSVYKQDYDEQTWTAITQAPVKTIKHLLTLQGFANAIGRPWGRSYTANEAPSPPHLCDRVQFHAELPPDRFEQLLARSGFIKVFLTPKDEDGKPSNAFRMIWFQGQVSALETLTAGQAGVAGLVKNRKGYGLRVKREAFEMLWKIVHPGQSLPIEHHSLYTYRVQPFPAGTGKEEVAQWGAQQDWEIHPIKTAGAKQWIVGTQTRPPPLLLWNGKPLIAHEIQKKSANPPVIVAGPNHGHRKPRQQDEKSNDSYRRSDQGNIFRQGDPWADPWAKAIASNDKRASTTPTPRPMQNEPSGSQTFPEASQTTRPLQGPVASQFQYQEQRLQALETTVQQIQNDQKRHNTEHTNQFQQLEKQFLSHQADTKQGIAQLVNDNKDFKQALLQQDQRLANSFDEIKKMFLQQGIKRTRSSPLSDEAILQQEGTDEEMLPDSHL